jgi:hypothetical protein
MTKDNVQEPVAWEIRQGKTDRVLLEITNDPKRAHEWRCSLGEVVPLYATPHVSQNKWVGLTPDEYRQLEKETTVNGYNGDYCPAWDLIEAVEAKLKEKNA